MNGGSIYRAIRIRRFEQEIKGSTIWISPTGLHKEKKRKTRTDKGLLPDPRPIPYPLHSLSFPFALETLETIVASLSQQ
jgi:hypothetical protein